MIIRETGCYLIYSHSKYGVRYFTKGISKGYFSRDNFPSGNFPEVRLGPLRHCRLKWGPSTAANMGTGAEHSSLGVECCSWNGLGKSQ